MNCEQVRLLLYLDRKGERSLAEDAIVAEHLSACPACAAEAARITEISGQMREIVQKDPLPRPRMTLVENVMARVAMRPKAVNPGFRWIESHALVIQYALGGALAAICILFNAQTLHDAKRLELLEERTGQIRPGLRETEALSAGMYGFSGRTEEHTLQIVISLFSRAGDERPQPLIDYWKKKYPGLASLRVTGQPTEEERRILETEGAAMVRELTKWINNGGRQ
jgi:hypothetical protein